jgi:hypothetical protein
VQDLDQHTAKNDPGAFLDRGEPLQALIGNMCRAAYLRRKDFDQIGAAV